jgi:hypothetical protein
MPKYLIAASYSGEGLQGLRKDKASGRRQAITTAIVSAAALGIATSATGLVRTRTTALMTPEEVDRALEKTVNYRAPGR